MNPFHKVHAFVTSLEEDFVKFYEKDNKAAGIRVRKGMQELKKLAQEIREDVQNKKEESVQP